MRDYGNTNAAPYASAPAVGAAGDTYWNTTTKALAVSDGVAWQTPPVADKGIAIAKLAVGSAVNFADIQALGGTHLITATSTAILTANVPASYRGGRLLVLADFGGQVNCPDGAASTIFLSLVRDATGIGGTTITAVTNPNTMTAPVGGSSIAIDLPAAGAHTISLKTQRTAGAGNWYLLTARLVVLEFA
jgi:hypothetical protein